MRKIGYVKIPEVHVGISPDWKPTRLLSNLMKDRRRKSARAQAIRFSKERLPDVGAALGR
jgi:hypothetical protein